MEYNSIRGKVLKSLTKGGYKMKAHENLKQVLEIVAAVEDGLRKNGRLTEDYREEQRDAFEWLEILETIEEDEENGWSTRNMEIVAELLTAAEQETK